MAQNYSGRQFRATIATADLSSQALGTATHTGTAHEMRMTTMNDIAFDAGFQRTDYVRTGRRINAQTDHIVQYGSGTWTWGFDWVCEHQGLIHSLLQNICQVADASATCAVDGDLATQDLSHGSATGQALNLVLHSPKSTEDRYMHSAILQDLTISMDMNTNAGRPSMSGTLMSGYKPTVAADSTSINATTPDFSVGLFDCGTTTVHSNAVICSAFSVTLSNPATRIGQRATTGEADGYVRGGNFDVTGSITYKLDDTAMGHIDNYIAAETDVPIVVEQGSSLSFNMPTCVITGYTPSYADEGAFVEVAFKALASADANLITIKMT